MTSAVRSPRSPRSPATSLLAPRDPDLDSRDPGVPRRRGEYRAVPARCAAAFQRACGELLVLLVPVECVCCGVEDAVICGVCAKKIRLLCAKPFRAEQQAPALVDIDGTATLEVVAAGPYREELSQALLSFKRLGQWRLANVLGACLARAVGAAAGGKANYCLVPVPSSGAAFRKRGFSPVQLLLASTRRRRLLPDFPVVDVLRKRPGLVPLIRRGASPRSIHQYLAGVPGRSGGIGKAGGQKGLGRGERARRVAGSMQVPSRSTKKINGQKLLIIDDVLTTGSTLAESARALSAAGGIVCGAIVLAATRPPAYASGPVGEESPGVLVTKSKNKLPKDE